MSAIAGPFLIMALTFSQPVDGIINLRLSYCCEWEIEHKACCKAKINNKCVSKFQENQKASIDGAWFAFLDLMERANKTCEKFS